MWPAVTRMYAIAIDSGTATACDRLPSHGSASSAIAGSPRKPMPSEASVMPNWHADRYSLRLSSICTTGGARRAPPPAHLLDLGPAGAHEGELPGDEEAVDEDQHDDRAEQQRGQLDRRGPGLC